MLLIIEVRVEEAVERSREKIDMKSASRLCKSATAVNYDPSTLLQGAAEGSSIKLILKSSDITYYIQLQSKLFMLIWSDHNCDGYINVSFEMSDWKEVRYVMIMSGEILIRSRWTSSESVIMNKNQGPPCKGIWIWGVIPSDVLKGQSVTCKKLPRLCMSWTRFFWIPDLNYFCQSFGFKLLHTVVPLWLLHENVGTLV